MPSKPITVVISSAGTGTQVALDWMRGGSAYVTIQAQSTTGATPSGGGVLQWTLDDITAGSTSTATSRVVWNPASSVYTSTAAGLVIATSNFIDSPFTFVFTPPVAALRFNCSAFSSTSLVMKVLQG